MGTRILSPCGALGGKPPQLANSNLAADSFSDSATQDKLKGSPDTLSHYCAPRRFNVRSYMGNIAPISCREPAPPLGY